MLETVTRNVSGAQMIEHWGTFARVNMRGFKIPAFRNGFNVDLPWGPLTEDMAIVERIEFVKGPAGFMLSSGEPGGLYNVVTKKPQPNQPNEVSLTAGNFNTLRSTLMWKARSVLPISCCTVLISWAPPAAPTATMSSTIAIP